MASTAQELFEELDELRDRNGNAANGSTDPDDQLDEDELSRLAELIGTPALIGTMLTVITPTSSDDITSGRTAVPLGMTSVWGIRLSPTELDALADVLRVHASLAKLAGEK